MLRHDHGFARDYREPIDFILLNDSSNYYQTKINVEFCSKNHLVPIRTEIIIRNSKTVKELIRFHNLDAQQMYPHSIVSADIYECSMNITDAKETIY